MREIRLSNSDKVALVDDEDFDELARWTWYLHEDGSAVRRKSLQDGTRTNWIERMHREIMGLKKGDKMVVDHKNQVRLDNQKANLRICTQAQNCCNCKVRKHSTTGLKGVARNPSGWLAYIRVNGKKKHLGTFRTPELAYQAVCEAREILHGEFANHG
jgi:hypothetical protein